MRHLKQQGLKIPEDISIMEFDNIDSTSYIEPGLTTISYPIEKLGNFAVDMLIDRIKNYKNDSCKEIVLEHSLIERESIGFAGKSY